VRVLLVSVFPPLPAPEANHALHLSEHLAAAGAEVHVLCQAGGIPATRDGITMHPVATNWSWSDLPAVMRCIRDCRPDVVYLLYLGWIYNFRPMITFLPTLCRTMFGGLPCVTQFEAVEGRVQGRSWPARMLRRSVAALSRGRVHQFLGTLLSDSTQIIALSSTHRDRLAEAYPPASDRLTILPPPPLIRRSREDPDVTRRRIRGQWSLTDEDFLFMYWGFIYPGKGIETLLHAFRSVREAIPSARLVLVGGDLEVPFGRMRSGNYARMVRSLPDKLDLGDSVIWTGGFDWESDAGSQYLFAADACVLPLDWGITLNNSALAAATTHGLPVIGTEVFDKPDEALEHGRNIYLCPPGDAAALGDAMLSLAEDAVFRERLRQGSRSLAAAWHSWPTMIERLGAVLASTLPAAQGRTAAPGGELPPAERTAFYPTDPPVLRLPAPDEASRDAGPVDPSPGGGHAPLVSVIVAVYNVERYLSQCLDALVNQTLKNIEVIVVNDASTDGSARIIDGYQVQYPCIRVVTCRVNQGLATVRNIGLSCARGAYVAFADGDDWVDIRMCEVMYKRAVADKADVLSASATVFYEDRKTFAPLFDQHVREHLDDRLKAHAFDLLDEPRALLLEVVAWTKIYRRSFLLRHCLQFEDGLNSYEDTCFHVFCLVKAERISVIDDALVYYRQNRPGQISGQTSRKVFEVFEVFRRIHETLLRWDVADEIWGNVIKIELRQYDWLLSSRVRPSDRAEFMAAAADRLRSIQESGWGAVRQADARSAAKLICMRKGWLGGYKLVRRRTALPALIMCLSSPAARRSLSGGYRSALSALGRETRLAVRSIGRRVLGRLGMKRRVKGTVTKPTVLPERWDPADRAGSPLIHVCLINGHALLIADRSGRPGLGEAVSRTEKDHYLAQTAVLREGDVVIDVGAHVGVWAIYHAMKFPFATVYAIEPDPTAYAYLVENITLNQVPNVVPINRAVAGRPGPTTLYTDPLSGRWATTARALAIDHEVLGVVEAEAITIERLCRDYDIGHVRILKVEAWGAVREVLEGLPHFVPIDFLCGEVDLRDCGGATLEVTSARRARHFFWRMTADPDEVAARSLHQLPEGLERVAPAADSAAASRIAQPDWTWADTEQEPREAESRRRADRRTEWTSTVKSGPCAEAPTPGVGHNASPGAARPPERPAPALPIKS
jgi:FkbM family methyltransferase